MLSDGLKFPIHAVDADLIMYSAIAGIQKVPDRESIPDYP